MTDQANEKLLSELDRISSNLHLDKQVKDAAANLLSHMLGSQQSQVIAAHNSSLISAGRQPWACCC